VFLWLTVKYLVFEAVSTFEFPEKFTSFFSMCKSNYLNAERQLLSEQFDSSNFYKLIPLFISLLVTNHHQLKLPYICT